MDFPFRRESFWNKIPHHVEYSNDINLNGIELHFDIFRYLDKSSKRDMITMVSQAAWWELYPIFSLILRYYKKIR